MSLLVGIDLGTTGTKAALYGDDGSVRAERTVPTNLRWRGALVDQDPEELYASAAGAVRACVEGVEAGAVAALAVGGQMAGTMAVDAGWNAVTPYDSWLDTRCAPEVSYLDRELGDRLTELSGCPPMVNHASKIRWWREHEPAAFASAAAWILPGAYVAGRLCGLKADAAFVDHTYLHFTGLVDARAGAWSPELAGAVGVGVERLPRIVAPTEIVGSLGGRGAADCGLLQGTPVAAGLGDTAASILGAGVVAPGQLLDVAGTAAVLAASVDSYRPDIEHRTLMAMRGAVPGQWLSYSYLSGGPLLSWIADLLGEEGFDAVTAQAARAPAGADGLLCVPHLDGRLLPSEPALRAAWVGLHRRHGRPHLARAALEGVAYEYAGYLRVLGDPGLEEVRVVGGGARSATWNAIKASVLGLPYVTLEREELGCWGAALVAGAAVGRFDDLAAAAASATPERGRIEPDPGDHERYARLAPIYAELSAALTAPSRRLAEVL